MHAATGAEDGVDLPPLPLSSPGGTLSSRHRTGESFPRRGIPVSPTASPTPPSIRPHRLVSGLLALVGCVAALHLVSITDVGYITPFDWLRALVPAASFWGGKQRRVTKQGVHKAMPSYLVHWDTSPSDSQLVSDLAPWRERGILLDDLHRTRANMTEAGSAWPGLEPAPVSGRPLALVEVWLIRGVPYVDARTAERAVALLTRSATEKLGALLALLRGAVRYAQSASRRAKSRNAPRVPDVYLLINLDPVPVLRGGATGGTAGVVISNATASLHAAPPTPMAPVLSLCKTDAHWDVLYPNMYFKSPIEWDHIASSLSAAHERSPWHQRREKMWWRGAAGNPAVLGSGTQLRIRMLTQWHSAPWADFGFTDHLRPRLHALRASMGLEKFAALYPPKVWGVPASTKLKMPMEKVANYKYALHLPGAFLLTYSRTLQFLLWTGACTFKVASPYYEFYYRHLTPWVHYVPTTVDGLGARVEQIAGTKGKLGAKISAHAIKFARARLSAPAIASYWVHLLRDYAALQRFSVAAGARGNSSVAGRSLCTCYSTLLPAELAGAISSSSATSSQSGAKGIPRAMVPSELCPALLCRWVPGSVASTVTALPTHTRRSRSRSGSSRAPTKV